MRLIGARLSPQGETFAALLRDDGEPARILTPLAAFWAAPAAALSNVAEDAATVPVTELVLVPPVPPGARVVCVALDPDGELRLEARWPVSLAVSGSPVPVPAGHLGVRVSAGIAAYVGTSLIDVEPEAADAAIIGHSTFADLAIVRADGAGHAVLARNGDNTGPVGPLHTREATGDLDQALRVRLQVGDRAAVAHTVRDSARTLAAAVSLVSKTLTLHPGDLVVLRLATSAEDDVVARPGDTVAVEVDRLGPVGVPVVGDSRRVAAMEPH